MQQTVSRIRKIHWLWRWRKVIVSVAVPLIVSFFGLVLFVGIVSQIMVSQQQSSQSSDVSTGGASSLTNMAFDSKKFHEAWLKNYAGGVLANYEDYTISAAKAAGINPALMAAIMGTESGWGKSYAIRNDNNPSGQMVGSTILHFDSLQSGIDATAKTLHNLVITNHLNTVDKLGASYAPVGAANDPNNMNVNWVPMVKKLLSYFGYSETSHAGGKGDPNVGNIALNTAGNTYPVGQCTWWVKSRCSWAGNWWGNGADWGRSGAKYGFQVDHTPQKGAIVSFAQGQWVGNWQADPTYGHVAFVEAYDANRGTITISQGGTGFSQQPGPNLQVIGNVGAFTYVHPK